LCPRFNAVIGRTEEEGVGLEDLDTLQTEIELMLINVTQRSIAIDVEQDALINWSESQIKPNKKSKLETPSKRKLTREEDTKPVKKLAKDTSSCSSVSSASTISSISCSTTPPPKSHTKSKSKNVASKIQHHSEYDHSAQKSDIPDRFLHFIEAYTAPIRQENVKLLEDMVKTYDDLESEFLKVPNLGKHYTTKWGKPDTVAESIDSIARGGCTSSKKEGKVKGKKKAGKKDDDQEKGSYGILTQRLLQSLLEDPNAEPNPDSPPGTDDGPSLPNGNVLKALSLGNTSQLEKRIKKELQENGLLDLLEDPSSSAAGSPSRRTSTGEEEDEILRELIRAQNELKVVAAQNVSSLKGLLSAARTDIERQEIQSRLDAADEQVIEAYKRLVAAKSKKKALSKKEKDVCLKALKERDDLLKELDSLEGSLPCS